MAHRSAAPDLARPERTERWDRDRYEFERGRSRVEDEHGHVYVRRMASRPPPPPDDRSAGDRTERRFGPRGDDEDLVIRERRRYVYDDEPRRRLSPPPDLRRRPSSPASEVERTRVVIEKERRRSPSPSPSPSPARRPPRLVRRQSSLDTFDRVPRRYYERDCSPSARRDDHRVPPYVDIPLPRPKALPPAKVYSEREREYFDNLHVSDHRRYWEEDFHARPERVREREIVRTRRRTLSRSRGRSRSSSTSSSSSSGGGTTLTSQSEYPKRGKTRIPARLVSKRALCDLGYPFVEEVRRTFDETGNATKQQVLTLSLRAAPS